MAADRDSATGSKHIVVLDDDIALRGLIADFLEQHGLRVTTVASGDEARVVLARDPAAALVLDVMMPGEDGLAILRSLADRPDTPAIIMMSAMGADSDRIIGLELGADDYLAKPVNPRELLARLKAVLRRARASQDHDIVRVAGWCLDPSTFTLIAPDGQEPDLTGAEFRLAYALAKRAGRIVSREVLLDELHRGDKDFFDRSVDVAISRLRAKLADCGGDGVIRTIRGEGYLFAAGKHH
ncbi:MAG: response regulator transcription factor [Sphingomonadaceae bacterium]